MTPALEAVAWQWAMNLWQRWKQTTIANKALAVTGVIVAIGTLGQVAIAVFNYHLMTRNAKDTSLQIDKIIDAANHIAQNINNALTATLGEMKDQSKAMQDAANASRENADAAISSAKTAKRTLELSQRSNLFFTNTSPVTFEYGKTPEITLWITNTGHIPATVFELSSGYRVGFELDLPKSPDQFPTTTVPENVRVPPVGKGMRKTFNLTTFNESIPHPKTATEYIQSGKAFFWFYIKCRYRDYFGNHHACTLFRYELGQLVIDSSASGYECSD